MYLFCSLFMTLDCFSHVILLTFFSPFAVCRGDQMPGVRCTRTKPKL